MPPPWLSLIIPTYNGEAFLATTLRSIVAQNEPDLECIIVDDGSTDTTIEIITAFADSIPITLKQTPRTGNWASNSNLALSLATGEYVSFLHQDDFWLADRLRQLKELTTHSPNADFIVSPAIFVDPQGRPVGNWRCPLPGRPGPVEAGLLLSRLLVQNFIAIPSPLFKRQAALARGGLDDSLWYTADWDFWLKMASATTLYWPHPLAAFRLHPHSQTVQRSFDIAGFRQQLECVYYRHAANLAANHPQKETIRRNALFSIQVNTALASLLHGSAVEYGQLFHAFIKLGPLGWRRYLRDSRLSDRISARLRARISTG